MAQRHKWRMVKPAPGFCVVRVLPEEREGNVILPEVAKEATTRAQVLAVGPERVDYYGKKIELFAQPGDIIVTHKGAPTARVHQQNPEILMISEQNVLCTMRDAGTGEEPDVEGVPHKERGAVVDLLSGVPGIEHLVQ